MICANVTPQKVVNCLDVIDKLFEEVLGSERLYSLLPVRTFIKLTTVIGSDWSSRGWSVTTTTHASCRLTSSLLVLSSRVHQLIHLVNSMAATNWALNRVNSINSVQLKEASLFTHEQLRVHHWNLLAFLTIFVTLLLNRFHLVLNDVLHDNLNFFIFRFVIFDRTSVPTSCHLWTCHFYLVFVRFEHFD